MSDASTCSPAPTAVPVCRVSLTGLGLGSCRFPGPSCVGAVSVGHTAFPLPHSQQNCHLSTPASAQNHLEWRTAPHLHHPQGTYLPPLSSSSLFSVFAFASLVSAHHLIVSLCVHFSFCFHCSIFLISLFPLSFCLLVPLWLPTTCVRTARVCPQTRGKTTVSSVMSIKQRPKEANNKLQNSISITGP